MKDRVEEHFHSPFTPLDAAKICLNSAGNVDVSCAKYALGTFATIRDTSSASDAMKMQKEDTFSPPDCMAFASASGRMPYLRSRD